MPRRHTARTASRNWKRLTIVTLGIYLGLAAFVLVICELVVPAVLSTPKPTSSGFNYGAIFGASFLRPFGWVVAGVLVILAPITLLVRGADALGVRLQEWVQGGPPN